MSEQSPYAKAISGISSVMARIHKLILESEIQDLEIKSGQPIGVHGRLQILLHAPELAWLRVMSQLMAAVDHISFQKEPITAEQSKSIVQSVDELMFKDSNQDFTVNYRRMMTSTPDLMIEHSQLRSAVKKLESLARSS